MILREFIDIFLGLNKIFLHINTYLKKLKENLSKNNDKIFAIQITNHVWIISFNHVLCHKFSYNQAIATNFYSQGLLATIRSDLIFIIFIRIDFLCQKIQHLV